MNNVKSKLMTTACSQQQRNVHVYMSHFHQVDSFDGGLHLNTS